MRSKRLSSSNCNSYSARLASVVELETLLEEDACFLQVEACLSNVKAHQAALLGLQTLRADLVRVVREVPVSIIGSDKENSPIYRILTRFWPPLTYLGCVISLKGRHTFA